DASRETSHERVAGLAPRPPLGARPGGAAHREAALAVGGGGAQAVDERVDVALGYEPAVGPVRDALGAAAAAGREDRRPGAHRLLDDEAEAVAEGGEREQVGGVVLGGERGAGRVRDVLEGARVRREEALGEAHGADEPQAGVAQAGAPPGLEEVGRPLAEVMG